MVRVPERVRDHPGDPAFARTYAALPDATDLEPWLGWARAVAGPVLYVGPGAGRLAVPLWRAGIRMVGVEPHPGMARILARRLPHMELVEAPIERADLGGRRFELVIGPSGVLGEPSPLAAAARASARHVGLELMNPHWLAGPGRRSVAVHRLTARRARLDVTYPNGDVQEVSVRLRPPERADAYLRRHGLRLLWMGAGPGGSAGAALAESPTYFVLSAISRRIDGGGRDTGRGA